MLFRAKGVNSWNWSSAKTLSLSPLRGLSVLVRPPTAYAVGCILAPLRGWLWFLRFQAVLPVNDV
jgi:hypothetical protein